MLAWFSILLFNTVNWKIGKWSVISDCNIPKCITLFKQFDSILSINVADLSVTLVGLWIIG